jgi:peroxiredoxin
MARLLLALVFIVAGLAKLADRPESRQAIIDFGLPRTLATPLGILLPLCELMVAAALIPTSTAWWGAIGALALLLLFVAGIGINLARGHKPDCHCFGQLHSSPAGWKTLGRNGALAAVAGFVVWEGRDDVGPSAVSWLGNLPTMQLVGLIAGLVVLALFAAQGWFLIHLLRQNGRLLVRLEALEERLGVGIAVPSQNGAQQAPGLPIGSQAPAFNLSGLYGERLTLESLRAPGKPVMLLFTDPNCGPCTAMLPEIGRWQEEHKENLTISLISRGGPEENRAKATEHGLQYVLLQEDWEVSEAYQAYGTPSAVLVQPDGTIGSPVSGGAEAIRSLLSYAVGERAQLPVLPAPQGEPCPNCGKVHPTAGHAQQVMPTGPKVGEPAPEIKLEDLESNTVELKDFKGEVTLVLFWNPGCGFCQQMLPDLKEWEANPPEGSPKLLVVSAGTEEANKEMGLRSPVVLDQPFEAGRAFGAAGTPSAVLVDEEGKIASEVAVGAPAVLELAGVVGSDAS